MDCQGDRALYPIYLILAVISRVLAGFRGFGDRP
jgi:hypothetical protein